MILAHANHLATAGHEVIIETSLVDTVFNIDSKVILTRVGQSGKLGTLWRSFITKYTGTDLLVVDIIPLACLLFFRNPGKVIYFAQDYDEAYYPFKLQKLFIRGLYFLGLNLFRIPTVVVSEKLGEFLSERFTASVEVAENGVDTNVFYHDPDDELICLKEGRKALVVLSRGDHRKGFDLVPEILNLVQKGYGEHFEVWTVGEKVDGGFNGLRHRDFGYVDENRLRQIFSSADLFLYPTRHEGFGLMVLEAMFCLCPFVTTEAVPVAEHGKGGFVCPVGDVDSLAARVLQLFQLRFDEDGLLQRGAAARSYSLENSQKRFEQILCLKLTGDRN